MIMLWRPVVKQCPHVDETDFGELKIILPGDAPELHELGTAVDALSFRRISHEDYTRGIQSMLPAGAKVITRWRTGPWTVEVTS